MTPDAHTIRETFLEVGDGHTLYIHDWGNKDATTPIIFLHGGPGYHTTDRNKATYDPTKQRVIFFDQRGCGKSVPYGSLEHNTTQDLVEDIEKIADHLELKTFVVTGHSWGSTLALAYALAHPERVKSMVLSGIFTGSHAEIDWIDNGHFRTFYPEAWGRYLLATPKSHHADPTAYHYKRVMGNDADAARESAYAYQTLEGSVLRLDDRYAPEDPAEFDPAGVRMEMHYLHERCFMPDRFVLDNAHKLTMPVWLVHGRYDMVCPPIAAYDLSRRLPNCQLMWAISGHSREHENQNLMRLLLQQASEA